MIDGDWWDHEPPSPEAFDSKLPFFHDTLSFSQWLQWVFLVRLRELSGDLESWPPRCDVAPMAEEYFKKQFDSNGALIIKLLREIDILITDS